MVARKKSPPKNRAPRNPATRVSSAATDMGTPDPDLAEPGSSGRRFLTKQLMDEWTASANALLYSTFDYNPDDLILSKGQGVRIYQQMTRDPYVKAGLSIKKLSVCRLPTDIHPASESAEDVKIARFVEDQFESMETPWHALLQGIMDNVNIGYSIGEINYRIIQKGEWAGKIGWDTVKSKDPYVYSFRIKKNGDVETIVQRFGGATSRIADYELPGAGRTEFPPEKFIVSTFAPLYSNPFGNSDLRSGYRAYFIKDWAWKFRAIFMEKWGSPTVIGTFPNGTSEARRKQLEDVLESIQQETTLTIPEDLKIELIRVATTANVTEYERAISDLNKEILVGLLGSFLAVEEGKKTGARAQGQVHLWIAKLFIEALVYVVEEDINRQMVRRLVDLNYSVLKYPKLKFELSRVDDLLAEMELDTGLQNMGFPITRGYIEKKYGRPVGGKDTSLKIDGVTDAAGSDEVLVPPAVKQAMQAAKDAKTSPAVGGKVKAAGPNDNPSTSLAEKMAGVFVKLREEVLPADPQKIGDLKDTYGFLLRTYGALRSKNFAENTIAFDLAGAERSYYQANKRWMEPERAYAAFLSRVMEA